MQSTRRSASDVQARVDQAAQRLIRAAGAGVPCAPVRDLIGPTDLQLAYGVQQVVTRHRLEQGARVVGRKIGLTSEAVQQQLGVDQPDFGVLFHDMAFQDGAELPMSRLLQPRAEAEIVFVLGEDLLEGPFDQVRVAGAVDYMVAGLEIVDSRITGWDIAFADTVADNASSGLYVLGSQRQRLAEFSPVQAQMRMLVDGQVVSTGDGAACLGDPLSALAWMAQTALDVGDPLLAGQTVLSGALGPMHPVHPGAAVRAEISGLGSVSAVFSKEER